jgi:NADH-quinone oxidoreductase subunit L
MQDRIGKYRYFILLDLCISAACWVVIADNLWGIFIGWELISLTSSLLISFWYQQSNAVKASMQAWIISKLGAICLLIGIVLVTNELGSCNIATFTRAINLTDFSSHFRMSIAGICFLIAVFTKSAQFPFFSWLPNAMAAPTPVSALLHAATVLSIGIYLLARVEPILLPDHQSILIIVGYTTAFMGATAALFQQHIKKLLAYSTLSQLGYVVAAIGLKTLASAIVYLLLHGLAKACLFLYAGIIIKFLLEQGVKKESIAYMDRLAGIKQHLPWIGVSYFLATITLVGLPGLAGFHAKEAILTQTLTWSIRNASLSNCCIVYIVPIIAFASALLTNLYLGRSFLLIFCTSPICSNDIALPIQKSNCLKPMQSSALALLICVLVLSLLPIKQFIIDGLTGVSITYTLHQFSTTHAPYTHLLASSISIGLLLLAILFLLLSFKKTTRITIFSPSSKLAQIFLEGWYVDALVKSLIKQILIFSNYIAVIEKYVIGGLVKHLTNGYVTIAYGVAWLDNKLVAGFIKCVTIGYVILAHIVAWIDDKLIDSIGYTIATILKSFSRLYLQIQKSNTQYHIAWSFISVLLILICWIIYSSLSN